MSKRKLLVFLSAMMLCLTCMVQPVAAKKNGPDAKAKELFTKVYNMTFGPQGSEFGYKVNIIGIYKTEGIVRYKGKKQNFEDAKVVSYQDGITAYIVDKKNKEIKIYDYNDERKDKYMSKFKFDINNFDYSYTMKGNYYLVTARVKNSSFFGIKWLTAKILKDNLSPVSLTVKLAFMKTTVGITNYHSGNIPDSHFVFPKNKFRDYKVTDYRNM